MTRADMSMRWTRPENVSTGRRSVDTSDRYHYVALLCYAVVVIAWMGGG